MRVSTEADTDEGENTQDIANNLDVPKERSNPVHFNVEDQRPYFELRMTFSCTNEVREEIAKYVISRGVALKFVRSEPIRIRVRCEDECPLKLYVSKDCCNLGLVVKTFALEHKCYRIFSNLRASAMFLTKLYKQIFLEKHDYKAKDLKQDVEKELRVHFAYSKCKRAMVLDACSSTFTSEYLELEVY